MKKKSNAMILTVKVVILLSKKEGYYERKGECIALTVPTNGRCPYNYYRNGYYCYERCSGVNCSDYLIPFILSLCSENNCLICELNFLKIISSCDNKEACSLSEGCLNCITNDECLVCQQGYYLLKGECKKCSEGCSVLFVLVKINVNIV